MRKLSTAGEPSYIIRHPLLHTRAHTYTHTNKSSKRDAESEPTGGDAAFKRL